MATMGKYCKAYLLKDLRVFSEWTEASQNARPEASEGENRDGTNQNPRQLTDESIVYLQENLTVTDDVFQDEYILFDKVTSAWETFCREGLQFALPDDLASEQSKEIK